MTEQKTYHVIGEVSYGDGAVAVEEVIHARTRTDAYLRMQLAHPGVDIVEVHLVDNEG